MARRRISREQWEELSRRAQFNANELACLCGVSVRQLQREFRRRLGRSPQDWLNEQRLIAARELLLSGSSVKKVALDLGFKHTSHFCRQFKLLNCMTPSEFVLRETMRAGECRLHITSVAHG